MLLAETMPMFVLPRERAHAKLRAGRPLLHDEPVPLDLAGATERFGRLAAEKGLELQRLDASALLTEAFVQHPEHVHQLADAAGLDAALTADLAERAVAPLRHAYADRLSNLVHDWRRGYCPICGSSPRGHGLVRCEACGCTWQAAAAEAAFRIELALPDEDA
jgi:hypothetical protein